MRSIPIPVDASRLAFVVATDPRPPRLVSQDTGEVKTDRKGQTVYQVVGITSDCSCSMSKLPCYPRPPAKPRR